MDAAGSIRLEGAPLSMAGSIVYRAQSDFAKFLGSQLPVDAAEDLKLLREKDDKFLDHHTE